MKLIYAYYCLDIIHTGHLLAMKNAKALAGDNGKLIIGILTDKAIMEKKEKPTVSFEERIYMAQCLKFPDLVVAQETYSNIDNLLKFEPDIIIESDTHDKEHIKQVKELVKNWNGKVIIMPYYPSQSSTQIKKRIKENG